MRLGAQTREAAGLLAAFAGIVAVCALLSWLFEVGGETTFWVLGVPFAMWYVPRVAAAWLEWLDEPGPQRDRVGRLLTLLAIAALFGFWVSRYFNPFR